MRKIGRGALITIFLSCIFVPPTFATEKAADTAPETDNKTASSASVTTFPSSGDFNDKLLLDENIRYISTPEKGVEFGLIRERRVRLKLDSSVVYDSNIYLTKDDTKYDIITHLTPGAYAYYGNENNMYLAYYNADVFIHSINTKESRINQVIGGRADLFRTGIMKLMVRDTLKPTTDQATSESQPFIKRIFNDFETKLRYDISEKAAEVLSYKQYIQYYMTSGYKMYNHIQHVISPITYWNLTPKTSLTAEYNLGITDYMGSANYNSIFHQARLGIEGRLTPKSTIYLRGGYQYRLYTESDRKNVDGFVMEGVYDYALSPKTTFEFVAASNINESIFEDVGYYKSINVYASMKHHILYNLDLYASGIYIRNNYPHDTPVFGVGETKRHDNIYKATARLTYRLRAWLSTYAQYDYQVRDSNIRDFGYLDNMVTGGVNISF